MTPRRLTVTTALGIMIALLAACFVGPANATTVRTGSSAVVKKKTIGHSVKGRAIKAWQLGSPKDSTTVVVFAAMHGNETAPRTILRTLRDGKKIKGVNLWVIPVVNPDGVARGRRVNARGVDLNRNFPINWRKKVGKYSPGKKAASEPETKAMMRFFRSVKPDYVINLHQPLYGVDTSDSRSPAWAKRLTKNLKLPRKKFRCGSTCYGTFTQWFNKRQKGTTITVELSRKPSKYYLTKTAPHAILKSIGGRRS